jgi:hypothetical protein
MNYISQSVNTVLVKFFLVSMAPTDGISGRRLDLPQIACVIFLCELIEHIDTVIDRLVPLEGRDG